MAANRKTTAPATESTMAQLQVEHNQEVQALEVERTKVAKSYQEEDKYTVMGAPMYQANFGRYMPIILNGVRIDVPLDGKRYEIPESFACVFNERIDSVNRQIELQRTLQNVSENIDSGYPGEKELIRQV